MCVLNSSSLPPLLSLFFSSDFCFVCLFLLLLAPRFALEHFISYGLLLQHECTCFKMGSHSWWYWHSVSQFAFAVVMLYFLMPSMRLRLVLLPCYLLLCLFSSLLFCSTSFCFFLVCSRCTFFHSDSLLILSSHLSILSSSSCCNSLFLPLCLFFLSGSLIILLIIFAIWVPTYCISAVLCCVMMCCLVYNRGFSVLVMCTKVGERQLFLLCRRSSWTRHCADQMIFYVIPFGSNWFLRGIRTSIRNISPLSSEFFLHS